MRTPLHNELETVPESGRSTPRPESPSTPNHNHSNCNVDKIIAAQQVVKTFAVRDCEHPPGDIHVLGVVAKLGHTVSPTNSPKNSPRGSPRLKMKCGLGLGFSPKNSPKTSPRPHLRRGWVDSPKGSPRTHVKCVLMDSPKSSPKASPKPHLKLGFSVRDSPRIFRSLLKRDTGAGCVFLSSALRLGDSLRGGVVGVWAEGGFWVLV
ncbi:hypothetical protein BaRGS_00000205 [Batillaria attramentaria]|uniref:Uncharacterized protein n=1 Tax=Batillaria attramentaria TaxID=370345 RepID=A0ABD0M9W8_9CAEN